MLRVVPENGIYGHKLYVYNDNNIVGYAYEWSKPDMVLVNDLLISLDTDNPAKQMLVYKRIQQYLNVEKRSPLEIVTDEVPHTRSGTTDISILPFRKLFFNTYPTFKDALLAKRNENVN